MNRFTLIVLASGGIAAGIASLASAQPRGQVPADTAALARGNNQFAFNLFQKLSKEESGNLFFSPYSISNALAMTAGGARGKTATEMASTLQFPPDIQKIHPAFAGLIAELNRPGDKQRKFQLAVANRLWGQKGYGFLPDFLTLTQTAYGAGLQELDFTGANEPARQAINAWVEKETQGKIKELFPPSSLPGDTRLVLTNAIYFKANWAEAFPVGATSKDDFKLAAGKTVKVDMMHQHEMWKLYESDSLQMLELPYEQHQLSMLVLLPRKVDGLADLEKSLTLANLDDWMGKMKRYMVSASMPKFKFTAEFKLAKVLSAMGMPSAFSKDADFSGMTTHEQLYIDSVVHKAFVAVDEKGTEAAAATGVVARPTSVPVAPNATFTADHPFAFLIRDNRTGSILFMGRVANPN